MTSATGDRVCESRGFGCRKMVHGRHSLIVVLYFPFLLYSLASLVFHESYLKGTMSNEGPYRILCTLIGRDRNKSATIIHEFLRSARFSSVHMNCIFPFIVLIVMVIIWLEFTLLVTCGRSRTLSNSQILLPRRWLTGKMEDSCSVGEDFLLKYWLVLCPSEK